MCNNETIMQGTTPLIILTVDPEDFDVSTATKIELYVQNGGTVTTYTGEDLTVNTEENTVTKAFSEEETAALRRDFPVFIQARFWFADDVIIGTQRITMSVADMLGLGD